MFTASQHMFACAQAKELVEASFEAAMRNVGNKTMRRKPQPLTMDQFHRYKFGEYSDDVHITSLAEFNVQKISPKHDVCYYDLFNVYLIV